MANPQKENGHVSVANDIWEALCRADIPGRQRRVLDVIIRKTWGWNKKHDLIPLSQLSEMTGIRRPHVCQLLNWLKAANMIVRDDTGKTSIQKDYEAWLVPPKGVPPKGLGSPARGTSRRRKSASPAEGNLLVPPEGHSKDTLSKDTLSKDSIGENAAPPPLAIVEETKLSPKDQTAQFFTEDREPTIQYLIAHGIPEQVARVETAKFVDYWTELNHSGKKQRWQMERTFEVRRRFVTWMQRVKHDRRSGSPPIEPKGIEL